MGGPPVEFRSGVESRAGPGGQENVGPGVVAVLGVAPLASEAAGEAGRQNSRR